MWVDAQRNARFTGRGAQMLAVAPDTVRSQLHHGIRVAKGTEGRDCSPFLACFLWKEQILRTVCVKCLKKSFELEVISGTRTVFIFQSTFRLFFSQEKGKWFGSDLMRVIILTYCLAFSVHPNPFQQ